MRKRARGCAISANRSEVGSFCRASDPTEFGSVVPVVQTSPQIQLGLLDPRSDPQFQFLMFKRYELGSFLGFWIRARILSFLQ